MTYDQLFWVKESFAMILNKLILFFLCIMLQECASDSIILRDDCP